MNRKKYYFRLGWKKSQTRKHIRSHSGTEEEDDFFLREIRPAPFCCDFM